MKRTLVIILILVFSFTNAQNSKDNVGYINKRVINKIGVWLKTEISKEKIEGSPYLFSSWFNTSKIYFDNVSYNINNLNYNVQDNNFVAKISNDSILRLNKNKFKKVVINNKIFKPYYDSELKQNLFFEELGEFKDFSFLKKNYVIILKGSFNPMTQNYTSPDRIVIKKKFYVVKEEQLILVKLKKSKILDLMNPDSKKEVISFVNKNKLSFNQEKDVIRVLRFYNNNLK